MLSISVREEACSKSLLFRLSCACVTHTTEYIMSKIPIHRPRPGPGPEPAGRKETRRRPRRRRTREESLEREAVGQRTAKHSVPHEYVYSACQVVFEDWSQAS